MDPVSSVNVSVGQPQAVSQPNDVSPDNPALEFQRIHQSVSGQPQGGENNPALGFQKTHQDASIPEEDPILGAILGAKIGAYGVDAPKGAYGLTKAAAKWYKENEEKKAVAQAAKDEAIINAIKAVSGKDLWNQKLTGNVAPGSQMSEDWLAKNRQMMETIGPGGELAGGKIHGGAFMTGPDIHAPKMAPELPPSMISKMSGTIGKAAPYITKGLGIAGRYLSPVAGGATAGYQGLEALNRLHHGDTTGAVINGIGALGGAASMYPPAAVVGMPISLGAEAINYYRDHPEEWNKYLSTMSEAGAQ